MLDWPGSTAWAPSYYVDGLCVLDERRQIRDLALFAMCLDAPELQLVLADVGG